MGQSRKENGHSGPACSGTQASWSFDPARPAILAQFANFPIVLGVCDEDNDLAHGPKTNCLSVSRGIRTGDESQFFTSIVDTSHEHTMTCDQPAESRLSK